MERRDFLKASCAFCLLTGAGFVAGALESCASLPVHDAMIEDNKISIPASIFSAGSTQIIRPRNFLFDIALRQEPDGTCKALVLQCTHASNELTPTETGYTCDLHGSKFDLEGNVTKGPAQKPLRRFPAHRENDRIVILVI